MQVTCRRSVLLAFIVMGFAPPSANAVEGERMKRAREIIASLPLDQKRTLEAAAALKKTSPEAMVILVQDRRRERKAKPQWQTTPFKENGEGNTGGDLVKRAPMTNGGNLATQKPVASESAEPNIPGVPDLAFIPDN